MNSPDPDPDSRPIIERKLIAIFNGLDGFGLILMFWSLMILELGGILMLIIGTLNVNWIPFFFGLLSLRIYLFIAKINREHIEKLKPFDG